MRSAVTVGGGRSPLSLGPESHVQFLIIISVISGIAFLAVWRPCLRAVHRSQRPPLRLSIVGGLVAALTMVGIFEGHSVVTGDFGIRDYWLLRAIFIFVFSFLVGSAASLIVVAAYRRRRAP